MKWTFNDVIIKVLKEAHKEGKKGLTSKEVYEIAKEKGYIEKTGTQGETPEATISARMGTMYKQ